MNLDSAVVYDVETLINCFTLSAEGMFSDWSSVWEISVHRDDRHYLIEWFNYLWHTQTPMIGFNNEHFDYAICHFIYKNPRCTVAEIYEKAQSIIRSGDRFAHVIWPRDRFAPQIDLFKIHHFDNKAKTTSLKALEVNMRSELVLDMPVKHDQPVAALDVDGKVIPYNKHDVKETKRFAHFSLSAIEFRIGLIPQFGIECLSWNDTKIGEKMMEKRLGDDICYDQIEYTRWDGSIGLKKQKRQTPRSRIALNDIIFPYVQFQHPEFQRVLDYMRAQVLTPDDLEDPDAPIKTKGVFTDLTANVGGVTFHFGTGGVHASVSNQRFAAGQGWIIRDIDVASLYPSIAIVNRLAPAHLGEAYVTEYAKLPADRKEWQKKKGKKCVEANSIKLAANGVYGKSNSKFSIFYDPQYTMTVTINGQLMLCMLAEWLVAVPTLQIIQVNTDGITYFINEAHEPQAKEICKRWEEYTKLTLEDADYSRMWIADVNTYIAESLDGSIKQKGRLWHPDPLNYAKSISECQPPAWHKDLSNTVSVRAAVAAMLHNIPPETFIRLQHDPYEFMCRVKAERGNELWLGERKMQSTVRYYVALEGQPLIKRMPANGPIGQYKKKNGVSDLAYQARMAATGGEWCETVCTRNKSKYEIRESYVEAGWKIAECNDARDFRWENVNFEWYVQEAKKLII